MYDTVSGWPYEPAFTANTPGIWSSSSLIEIAPDQRISSGPKTKRVWPGRGPGCVAGGMSGRNESGLVESGSAREVSRGVTGRSGRGFWVESVLDVGRWVAGTACVVSGARRVVSRGTGCCAPKGLAAIRAASPQEAQHQTRGTLAIPPCRVRIPRTIAWARPPAPWAVEANRTPSTPYPQRRGGPTDSPRRTPAGTNPR